MSNQHEQPESRAGRAQEHIQNSSAKDSMLQGFIHVTDFLPAVQKGQTFTTGKVFPTVELPISGLAQESALKRAENTCRWIHIPVNDVGIAHECVRRLVNNGDAASQLMYRTWMQKRRPAISDSPVKFPSHAWSMEPSIQIHDGQDLPKEKPHSTLFLPYLNWEHFQKIKDRNRNIIKPEMRHQRRTLDEFYHSGLQDTTSRNAGQTVSKWTGKSSNVPENGRTRAVEDSLVMMVDQLWIWTLDEDTLVSCFPTGEPLRREGISYPDDLDVMASATGLEDLEKCLSILDLLAVLAHRSINRIFEESKSGFVDMLSIYRWAAANKVRDGLIVLARYPNLCGMISVHWWLIMQATRHTELLEAFSTRQSGSITEDLENEGAEELSLILEVVDILDELNILMLLLEKQRDVVRDLYLHYKSERDRISSFGFHPRYALDLMEQAVVRVEARQADTERLRGEVTQTHGLLLELLDLEQKAASLGEARVTTKQGQAVMLFTIVTIIFLPLSFFTSYFGQNVVEFTGDDKNPKASEVWKVGAPISVVVIVVALIIAFFIMSSWKRSKVARATMAFLRRHRQRGRPQADIPLSRL